MRFKITGCGKIDSKLQIAGKYGFSLVCALLIYSFCASELSSRETDDRQGTIMQKKDEPTFRQRLKGDTIRVDTSMKSGTALPGKYGRDYLPEQDSAYFRALRLKVNAASRLQYRIDRLGLGYLENQVYQETQWDIAHKNMDMPAKIFMPKAVEIVMHQVNIAQAMYVPFVNTYNPNSMQIPLDAIGRFLGVVEDVSPVIKYDIDFNGEVEIVVYSTQASVVATVFKGKQLPGHYEVSWSLRDDSGKRMPKGDYIAEVRIGNLKYIRKRIVIP